MTFCDIAKDHAGIATGLMGWSPATFWAATPVDWATAWRAWSRAHGFAQEATPVGASVVADLIARFPDGVDP